MDIQLLSRPLSRYIGREAMYSVLVNSGRPNDPFKFWNRGIIVKIDEHKVTLKIISPFKKEEGNITCLIKDVILITNN